MADTKNFGLKGVGNDVQLGKAGSRFNLSGTAIQARNAADGAFVNFKILTPVADEDAATKLYVDNVAQGLDPKESCQAATTAAGVGTYATSPSNGQFTAVAASIDGVTLAENDRVLVKDQADAKQNGIYVVQATTTTITRAADQDGSPAAEVSAGNYTFVEAGTANADTGWVLQGDGELTLNTDNLDWVQFSGAGTYTAGVGLSLTGAEFAVDIPNTTALTDVVATGDSVIMYNSANNGQAIGQYETTVDQLKTFMNAGTSSTSITEGNSTLSIADAGAGVLTTNIDGTDVIVVNLGTTTWQNGNDITLNTGSTLAITDLTDNDVLIAGASGVIEDSGGALTFNGTTLAVTGALTVDNISIDLNTISSTAGTDLNITPLAGQQLVLDGTIIIDAGSMTGITTLGFDTVSLTNLDISTEFTDNDVSIMTSAAVDDRILSYGYSTTTGTITGTVANNQVAIGTGASAIDSSANLTFDGTTLTVAGVFIADEITIDGDVISNNTTDQPLILRPNGTGSLILQNGSGEEVLELLDTVAAINGLSITPGATGVAPLIALGTGADAVDIGFIGSGTGVLTVTGTTNYETQVTDPDDIPNKQYVDDAIQAVGGSGTMDSVMASISLATPGAIAIGAATGIPANCTIVSTTVDITTITDTAVTVTVGDATTGAASYMVATENDPEVQDIYIADGRTVVGGSAVQANATVGGVDGTVGNATIIITFRHV